MSDVSPRVPSDKPITFGQFRAALRAAADILSGGVHIVDKTDHIHFCCHGENAEFSLEMLDMVGALETFIERTRHRSK